MNMGRWIEKIDLRGVLNEYDLCDESDDAPDSLKKDLAAEVRKSKFIGHFASRFSDCCTIGDLDDVLEELYDVADARRVWTGG